jgi:hypothetical protein
VDSGESRDDCDRGNRAACDASQTRNKIQGLERVRKRGAKLNALNEQVGGSHYKDMKIQPVAFIHANNIGFLEGSAIKYLCRWRKKGGVEDLKKAIHFIELLIEMEESQEKPS